MLSAGPCIVYCAHAHKADMTVGVAKEMAAGEDRVALVPSSLKPLLRKGIDIIIEAGAGTYAFAADEAFADAGAHIGTREVALSADIVACVHPPSESETQLLKKGSVLAGFLQPLEKPAIAARLAAQGVTALAMELIPRISRAQSMDALSAMASLAGYKAVLLAAARLPRFFPLLTTAAGTIRPANVTVLGAGVAGLQAIATARRLGARVWGYDIREVVREEVQSLGAQFVELDLEIEDMEDDAGYARALMAAKAKQQADLLVPHLAKSDVVITTAQIPGRTAPLLVTEAAVKAMKPGSVIVDLAAPSGGNCALTRLRTDVIHHGVTVLGPANLPATMPADASYLYARTMTALIGAFIKEGQFAASFDDDIFSSACITHGGQIVSRRVLQLLAA